MGSVLWAYSLFSVVGLCSLPTGVVTDGVNSSLDCPLVAEDTTDFEVELPMFDTFNEVNLSSIPHLWNDYISWCSSGSKEDLGSSNKERFCVELGIKPLGKDEGKICKPKKIFYSDIPNRTTIGIQSGVVNVFRSYFDLIALNTSTNCRLSAIPDKSKNIPHWNSQNCLCAVTVGIDQHRGKSHTTSQTPHSGIVPCTSGTCHNTSDHQVRYILL